MNLKSKKMKTIAKILFAICYFGCCLVLIVEAALPGNISSNQSNTIGGGIADIINNGAGDQSVLVKPTGIKLNKAESTTLYVGETLQLKATLEPENCSFQSVSFESDDSSVLTVSEGGKITASKSGTATIKAYSTSYKEVSTSLTFQVLDVKEEAIVTSLKNCNITENGFYLLQANHSYSIENVFTPENTTDKSITYSLSSPNMTEEEISNHVSISSDILYAKKMTEDSIIQVTAISKNGLSSSFSIQVEENKTEVIPLESISVDSKSNPSYSLAVKESIDFSSKFQISYSPSNATYKNYRLESSDSSIIQVSGTKIIGVSLGECDIKVYSTYYDLSSSIRVSVKERALKDISISLNYLSNPRIKKGSTSYIRYSNASPNNSDSILQKLYDYSSSDNSILQVDSTGKVTAKEKGTATVTMNFYADKESRNNSIVLLSKKIDITVFEPSKISAIDYKNTLDETADNSHVIYNGKEYNLATYIKVDNMYDIDGNLMDIKEEGVSTVLEYKITNKSSATGDLSSVTINGNTLSTKENADCGIITIEYTHPESSLSESIQYILLNEMNPTIENEDTFSSNTSSRTKKSFGGNDYDTLSVSLSLYVASNATIRFDDNQSYAFKLSDASYVSTTSITSSSISFRGVEEGSLLLLVTPIYNDKEITGASKLMEISVYHKVATSFVLHLYEQENEIDLSEKTDESGNVSLSVYVDSLIRLETVYAPFLTPTKYQLNVTSSDKEMGNYKDSQFVFDKVGKVKFLVKEEISGYSKEITFYVINRVKLNEENPISIKQSKVSYDKETNTYHIENGTPANIITNFDSSSTFQSVKYQSSDEEILKVGDDGAITPLKAGTCDIQCQINDNNSIDYRFTVHVTVDKKKLITNMTTFLYYIRKGLGHFGAFLITAVFSVLFYLFVFDDKRNWFFSIPFLYLQGLFVAELTEFIQLFTPNRSGLWSDVLIDFTGFGIGATLTLAIILLYYLVKYLIKRNNKKKDNNDSRVS